MTTQTTKTISVSVKVYATQQIEVPLDFDLEKADLYELVYEKFDLNKAVIPCNETADWGNLTFQDAYEDGENTEIMFTI